MDQKTAEEYRIFWEYLSQNQKDLILEGQYLIRDVLHDHADRFKDYSFVVFPFAKAFEGFLKQLFKDAGFISPVDYISDHLRLGKLLSPNLVTRLGDRSLYAKLIAKTDKDFAERVWQSWKTGRNQVFHYFPHNLKALSFGEAQKYADMLIETMKEAYMRIEQVKTKTIVDGA